ncbi:hypothetical protein [Streptomyces sp. NPDC005438]|uniref:SCO4983 family protein n=1 Tax=Streptomyces sp. NPDC005438 TaxID=3156880 RepID=UPI0033BA970A
MYEPIRTPSVHTMTQPAAREDTFPHRSRVEELEIRLAGHLTALLTVTDEIRALEPSPRLDRAARRIAQHVARLQGRAPLRAAPSAAEADPVRIAALHQRAHNLAGNALVVANALEDTASAQLASARVAYHAEVLGVAEVG